ncbi:uncharacterized protein LOC108222273 isoform X1 [Daucus carota subsp. sativus]|uniref:uncharacterized protein LOC108222273 isoform X1 n=1 Tax=Daucus carota subsp. sativus TaxID=79200 RepID=UPI003083A519
MSVPILLRLQALRTQPLFPDGDGCPFWRLNCYPGESNILVQDSIVFGEKWITFDNEQEKVVEKHLSPPDSQTQLLTILSEWNGVIKSVSSTLVGLSPEFEPALYRLCLRL